MCGHNPLIYGDMMKIYVLKTCDTCTKALKSLRAGGHDPVVVDVRKDGVSSTELSQFYAVFGDDLINRRSTTWRGLDESQRMREPVALLRDHPTLMKRPVVETGGTFYLGWGKDVQADILG